jgi:hypothetical protein
VGPGQFLAEQSQQDGKGIFHLTLFLLAIHFAKLKITFCEANKLKKENNVYREENLVQY